MTSPVVSELLELLAKRAALLNRRNDIHTLVVGSSHGDYAFNPAFMPGSFNFCMPSQDLRHSLYLYSWLAQVCSQARNVILFYSVFSNGMDLSLTGEKWKCAAYKEAFSLKLQYGEEIERTFEVIQGLSNIIGIADGGHFGFIRPGRSWFYPETYGAERRALDHLRYNLRGGQQPNLKTFLELAKHHGHAVTIVISPARRDYIRCLRHDNRTLFRDLYGILAGDNLPVCRIIDCLGAPQFTDAMFGDYDHLLPLGDGPALMAGTIAAGLAAATGTIPAVV